MGHQLESLLTTYFSQQEEMGMAMTLLADNPHEKRGESIEKIPSQIQSTETAQVEQGPIAAPSIQSSYHEEQSGTVSQVEESVPEPQPTTVQPPAFPQNGIRDHDTIRKELADLYYRSKECTACTLCQSRSKVVFGAGYATADILIVGEAPGFEEDQQGLPFVGPAGQLLTKMLTAINVDREKETFICNVLKCRPPGNRTPSTQESLTCLPILKRQISIIRPKIILLLGKTAANTVLDNPESINKLRGQEFNYHGIPTYVSYHPAALLRNSTLKRPAWEDLQKFQVRYRELIDG